MCDCFHLAFPNWHAASSGTGPGRRLQGPEPSTGDNSVCDEPAQFTEGERPRPQGSSPVEEFPETEKYDSDKECEAEHDPCQKGGTGKKPKKSGLGSMFEKRSTPKMSKLKELPSPESGVIVKTAKDGNAEGLIYGGGGKDGLFIKEVVPESPASKNLKLKEGDQVLSATVYFDNVPYEDAIQILEHAQAYRMKLCLKRKPEIIETDPAMESELIPEEECSVPEMREPGKNKRRGDARISWPKFPSFGKGRKSRFTRSHSTSEADEQRKLELSPTTSDTESPIKSQDVLKGKKRHKVKLPVLTKRGRMSSSEEQDSDLPTTGPTSGDIHQTVADMLSPECLGSLEEDLKVVEDFIIEQNYQKDTKPQSVPQKVELISIGSSLKTEDTTAALADQGSPCSIKSPKGKKSKKEKSQLKMKILGKERSHKKDTKAKGSPKRLKTLGASIEIADQNVEEKSDTIKVESHTEPQGDSVARDADPQISDSEMARSFTTQMEISIPTVELDFSDVPFMRKSPQKEPAKMDDIKSKQETKTSTAFKLPKLGFGDTETEETIHETNVQECPAKPKKKDPYEQLSERSHTKAELPKREDIEIPGMEDMSVKAKTKIKVPKVALSRHYDEIKSEAVQLSIDVDSVKEAVSKLPGYKLPKVDTSGMPIPEEITVIDANAQRISVKTPTKVSSTKSKHEVHLTKTDIPITEEISKTKGKLAKVTPTDITIEEHLLETNVHIKPHERETDFKKEVYKREEIIIPGTESKEKTEKTQHTIGIKFESQSAAMSRLYKSNERSTKSKTKSDVKISEIESIDYIDSTSDYLAKSGQVNVLLPDVSSPQFLSTATEYVNKEHTLNVSVPVDVEKKAEIKTMEKDEYSKSGIPTLDISLPNLKGSTTVFGLSRKEEDKVVSQTKADINVQDKETVDNPWSPNLQTVGEPKEMEVIFKMPKLGFELPKYKGPEVSKSATGEDRNTTAPKIEAKVTLPKAPGIVVDVSTEEKSSKSEVEAIEMILDEKESKFKIPSLGITMPKMKTPESRVMHLEHPEVNVTLTSEDGSIPQQKMKVDKLELEMESPQFEVEHGTEDEVDKRGTKFKMPKFGFKMPKVKSSEIDLNLSKKDVDVTLTETVVKPPEAPEVDITVQSVDVSSPEKKMEKFKPEVEIKPQNIKVEVEGQGSKFKMPKFGIKMPKIKGPEFDLSLSRKDDDVILPEAKIEVTLPDVPDVDVAGEKVDSSVPKQALEVEKPDLKMKPPETELDLDGQGSKFKMPKLGIKMPKMKGPELDFSMSSKDVDVTLPGAEAQVTLPDVPDVDVSLEKVDLSVPKQRLDVDKPDLEIKPLETDVELDGQGSKFKMPKFGIKMPKIKGPEWDFSLSKKDTDSTLPTATADIKLPEAPEVKSTPVSVDISISEQQVEIEKPELEFKHQHTEIEIEGQGGKFKMPKFGIKMPKLKAPEMDSSLSKKDVDITLSETQAKVKLPEAPDVDVTVQSVDVSIPEHGLIVIQPEVGIKPVDAKVEVDAQGSKFKMPKFGIKMPKIKGPELDFSLSSKDVDVTLPEAKAEVTLPDVPDVDVSIEKADISVPKQKVDVEKPDLEIKPLETEIDLDGQGSKFKMPKFGIKMPKIKGPELDFSLSSKNDGVTLLGAEAEVPLPDVPDVDVSLEKVDLSVPKQRLDVDKPDLEKKPIESDVELDGHGGKFKMPKFGIKMPKIKGPEWDFSSSKKDTDSTLPIATAEVKLPEAPEVKSTLGSIDISISEQKVEIEKPELEINPQHTEIEIEGQGGKFKMPKFGIKMPKLKAPEMDLSLSKKDGDVTLCETQAEIKLPEAPDVDVTVKSVEVSIPEHELIAVKPEVEIKPLDTKVEFDGKGSKFKMPKFGIKMPKMKGPELDFSLSRKDDDVTLPDGKVEVTLPDVPNADITFEKVDFSVPKQKLEFGQPNLEIKPLETEVDLDGQGSKFKMPKFGIKMPKIKGPELDFSLSSKNDGVTLLGAEAEVPLPDVPDADVSLDIVDPTIPKQKLKVDKPDLEMKPLESDVELDGHGSKFKMPKFGIKMPKIKGPEWSRKDTDTTLPIATAEVKFPEAPEVKSIPGSVDVSISEQKVEIETPELEMKPPHTEIEVEGQEGTFKMPKFGIKMPKLKAPEIDLSLSKRDVDITLSKSQAEVKLPEAPEVDVTISFPEQKLEVKKPEVEIKPIDTEIEVVGQDSKFKMPKFGIKMPKIKGPELDFSLSSKDVDVTLPEAEAEVTLPDVPDVDISLEKADLSVPKEKLDVEKPDLEIKPLEANVELDGQGSKFKMPKFGIKMPKIKGPELDFHLSSKNVDVTLPETKHEVTLPDVPDVDVSLEKADLSVPKQKLEVKKTDLEIKPLEIDVELDGQGSKFKMPKFGIKMPKFKGPELDLSLSKKDVDVTLIETSTEVKLPEAPNVDVTLQEVDVSVPEHKFEVIKPDLEIKPLATDIDLDGQGSKFKMPKFGIKMPKMKGPELDFNLSKKDMESTLPEVTAEVKLAEAEVKCTTGSVDVAIAGQTLDIEKPDLEIKPPHTEFEHDEQRSKFKMPKFGIKMPKLKAPEMDLSLSKKDVDITLIETKGEVKLPEAPEVDVTVQSVDVSIPEQKLEVIQPEVETKSLETKFEVDGQGSKFKMPKFGIKMPKIKGPELDFSMSSKDVDVTLPGAEAEVTLPDVPNVDVSIEKADLSVPKQKVDVEKPNLEIKPLETDVELDGQGSKFKMPKFGIKMPKIKGPEWDLSLSKKDTDSTLPTATAEVNLTEASGVKGIPGSVDISISEQKVEIEKPELEIKPPHTEIELEGQGSKFKMPKFGIKMPKLKGPEVDLSLRKKDVDVTLTETHAEVKLPEAPEVDVTLQTVDVSIPEQKLVVVKPEVDIKPLDTKVEFAGQGSKFKMPKFGIKMPKMKGPEFDLDLSCKVDDVTVPEAKAEVTLPDVPDVDISFAPKQKFEVEKPEVELKPHETDIDLDGQGPKFKMPKFGIKMPKMKGPELDFSMTKKDIECTLPDTSAEVKLPEAPEINATLESVDIAISEQKLETEKTDLELKPTHTDIKLEVQGSKVKMPKFGIKMPKLKAPEIDLSFSKKDVDVTITETKTEVKLPEAPEVDVTLQGVDVSIPEQRLQVLKPEVEIKTLDAKAELDGHESKFKMPKFGIKMPKIKGPEFDLSLSSKDVDVTLPEAKAEVTLPDVPDVDVSLASKDLFVPEQKLEVKTPALEIKPMDTEIDTDGSKSKIKKSKFGIKMPKLKGPDLDLSFSRKDIDVTLPEAKAEVPDAPKMDVTHGSVNLPLPKVKAEIDFPDVKLKEAPANVDIKVPEIETQTGSMKESPSKFKLPSFKFPKFGVALSNVSAEAPDVGEDIKVEANVPEIPGVDVSFGKADAKLEKQKPEAENKQLQLESELDGKGIKLKMPKIAMSMPKVKGPEIDFSLSDKDAEIKLPEGEAEVDLPDVEPKESSDKVDVKVPEIEAQMSSVKGSPSKFKLPTFKFPKFGGATPDALAEKPYIKVEGKIPGAFDINPEMGKVSILGEGELCEEESKFNVAEASLPKLKGPEININLSKKDAEVKLKEAKAEDFSAVELKEDQSGSLKESPSKFKFPTFKFPKFGVALPSVSTEVPSVDKDVKVGVKVPETPAIDIDQGKAEVLVQDAQKPEIEIKPLEPEGEFDDQEGNLKMSFPKVKGPEIDLGLSNVDGEIKLQVKEVEPRTEVKSPEIEAHIGSVKGSPSKLKLPTFKFPKFGSVTPNVSAEVQDTYKDGKAEIDVPKDDTEGDIAGLSIDIKGPSLDLKTNDPKSDGKASKFKVPKFGLSLPKVQGPKIDLTVSNKDGEVNFPDAQAKADLQEVPEIDVHLGKAEVIIPEAKIEIQKPQVKLKPLKSDGKLDGQGGGISIKDAHIKMPEAEAEVSLSDVELKGPTGKVEVKAPDAGVQSESLKGSPSKFKLPTFKLPKFGMGTQTVSAEVPDVEGDVNIDTKIAEVPEIDAQLGTDVTITEIRGEIQKPIVGIKPLQSEVELGGQGSKLKKSRFSMPKISLSKPSVKATGVDVSLHGVTAALPDADTQVEGEVDMRQPEQDAGVDGQGNKFKMPKIGVTMQEVSGQQIDISLSKNDGKLTKQDAKAEVKPIKVPSAEMETTTPKIKVVTKSKEGSPSKFKMPTFKLPKFGDGSPKSAAVVPTEISDADIDNPEEVLAVEIVAPSISKKGIDETIPEVKVDVQIPGAEKEQSGSPLKFKMPTFTLPKFGGAATPVNVEIPDAEQEFKVKVEDMNLTERKTEGKLPDMEISESEAVVDDVDGKLKKTSWTLPKFSFAKTSIKGPEVNISLNVPEVDVTQTEAKTDGQLTDNMESKEVAVQEESATDLDIKLKKQKFSFPKFTFSKQSSKELDVSVPEGNVDVIPPEAIVKTPEGDLQIQEQSKFKIPKFGISVPKVKGPDIDINLSKKDTDGTVPKAEIEATIPESPRIAVELEPSEGSAGIDGKGSKFKMPRFGITMPKGKSTEIDLSKKDTDVTIPEVKAEVQPTEVKQPSAKVEIGKASKLESSPSKLKMPTITLPRLASTKVSVQVTDVNKDIKTDGAKEDVSKVESSLKTTAGIADAEGSAVELKGKEGEIEGSEGRFRMPRFGISVPKVKGPEIDLSMTNRETDPLPDVEIKETESSLVQDASTAETEAKSKRPNWSFPKFSFSKTSGKVPDIDVDTETPKDDVKSPEVKGEVCSPNVEVKAPLVSIEEPIYAEVDASLKKTKFSLPKISFSKSSAAAPESVEVPQVEVSLLEGEVKVKQPEMKIKTPEVDVNTSHTNANIMLPDIKAEFKLPDIELKESSDSTDTEAKSKGVGGSPLKFKMPTFKMPKFGGTTYEVSLEASDAEKIETDAAKPEGEATVKTKAPSVDGKSDTTQDATLEEQQAESDSTGHDSPSRFKLPSFKMPKLGFSRSKPEENVPADHQGKENQPKPEEDGKSQVTLTSFSDILENIDVEFDVSKPDKVEENLETGDLSGTQPETDKKDTGAKQDATKSPEKTGWFKFPRFGLSSPSEPVKTPEKDKHGDEKSPVGETGAEELSPTFSVQSSDAFADVSSTMTSEHVGPSLSSPTKVTVKYSDPDGASGSEEIHSKVVTSTTKTELISVEPNLPEKITILSSAASSSSEDTLQLKSGKIHIITSNIQATPEAHHAKLLTAIQVQPTSNFPLQSEAGEAMSWTTEESQSGKRMVFEKHFYQETSSQKCESKETVVITKQVRQISGETATSIQRLKDSVHTEKMRFFDEAKK